ncbi:carboxypeptidase-like regulatory domain-containing protein [Dyadobacter sp.]|uniref:carboxypeptidase-like regulatory domain-containing protein n=1 Tax=Dyadobacter sp. TaxID=1914288 RepID=UPI003F7141E1
MKANRDKISIAATILHLTMVAVLQGCFVFSDRTTSVYGTVTDDKGLPLPGVGLSVYGRKKISHKMHMATAYTDSSGHYEITVDVAGKFHTLDCYIDDGAIFMKYFPKKSSYETFTDGKKSRCCTLAIGEKTNFDFHIIVE